MPRERDGDGRYDAAGDVLRRWLDEGVVPPPAAVRVEELVNFFDYDYEVPRRGLEISVDGGPSPFDDDNVLVRVGVQAEVVAEAERPPVSLTFIVDTSGSMDRDDRLGLDGSPRLFRLPDRFGLRSRLFRRRRRFERF